MPRHPARALDPAMTDDKSVEDKVPGVAPAAPGETAKPAPAGKPAEIGGPKGLDPTRYGDWERDGRCVDF